MDASSTTRQRGAGGSGAGVDMRGDSAGATRGAPQASDRPAPAPAPAYAEYELELDMAHGSSDAAFTPLSRFAADSEGAPTASSVAARAVEADVGQHLTADLPTAWLGVTDDDVLGVGGAHPPPPAGAAVLLARDAHVAYLARGLQGLPGAWASLDASRGWILYWILHSLDVLDAVHGDDAGGAGPRGGLPEVRAWLPPAIELLRTCQAPSGGFGGGPGQAPHTAATYAAVLALLVIGGPAAWDAVHRPALHAFFMSLKDDASGAFRIQGGDGEMDVRATYTVLAVAHATGVLTPALAAGAADYVAACQTHEGGFGGEPGNEAHGGYTFCALAALHILGEAHRVDGRALARWLARRQLALEGGFAGRVNKLVDGCYSFWQGACVALLSASHGDADLAFDRTRLQGYVLGACQAAGGGLRDKPGASRDFYHTCYCLSGLSVAQHDAGGALLRDVLWGGPASGNAVAAVDLLLNVRPERLAAARAYYAAHPAALG